MHPLRLYLRLRAANDDSTVEKAAAEFAKEVTAAGAPVKPRTILSFADGMRRPRPPLSEVIARLAKCDELALLKWGRSAPADKAA